MGWQLIEVTALAAGGFNRPGERHWRECPLGPGKKPSVERKRIGEVVVQASSLFFEAMSNAAQSSNVTLC